MESHKTRAGSFNLAKLEQPLKPVAVRNPYAEHLTLPAPVQRRRRTNRLYLAFIEAVAFYHQYQREVRTDAETGTPFIEVTVEDIAWANRLLGPVLVGRSDELSGACRRFFEALKAHLAAEGAACFRAAPVRRALGVSPSSLSRYLLALRQHGLLEIEGGSRVCGYVYRLTEHDVYRTVAEGVEADLTRTLERLREV